jgi:2-keto-4-pentenoate hydratase/2-oxohepta-3-ene-1,7-dioic acid hydratase in catechol pathway
VRFVTYDPGEGPRAGVLHDGGVVDAWEALCEEPPHGDRSLRALIADRGLEAESREFDPSRAIPLADVRLLPPIPNPDKIIMIGLNYRSHAEEQGAEPPETPTFFCKFRNALVADGAEVELPAYSRKVDYEAEVAFVIGRRCRNVDAGEALGYVAGYTLLNDLSARDYQFMTPQWLPGKVFDGSAPCGPALVDPDEAGDPTSIGLSLTLNGETMQSATTADLVHSVADLIVYLSKLMTLEPGDIVSTGTPAGVGSLRDPHVWLKPGDEVVVESPTLGRLETRLR